MSKELRDQLFRELAYFRKLLARLGEPWDTASQIAEAQLVFKISDIKAEIKELL